MRSLSKKGKSPKAGGAAEDAATEAATEALAAVDVSDGAASTAPAASKADLPDVQPAPPDDHTAEQLRERMEQLTYSVSDEAAQAARLLELRGVLEKRVAELEDEESEVRDELARRTADDAELLRCLHTRRFDVETSSVLLERHVRCIRWLDTLTTGNWANVTVTAPPSVADCSWNNTGPEDALRIRTDSGFTMLPVRDEGGASVVFVKIRHLLDGVAAHSVRAVMIATIQGMCAAPLAPEPAPRKATPPACSHPPLPRTGTARRTTRRRACAASRTSSPSTASACARAARRSMPTSARSSSPSSRRPAWPRCRGGSRTCGSSTCPSC